MIAMAAALGAGGELSPRNPSTTTPVNAASSGTATPQIPAFFRRSDGGSTSSSSLPQGPGGSDCGLPRAPAPVAVLRAGSRLLGGPKPTSVSSLLIVYGASSRMSASSMLVSSVSASAARSCAPEPVASCSTKPALLPRGAGGESSWAPRVITLSCPERTQRFDELEEKKRLVSDESVYRGRLSQIDTPHGQT